MAQKKVDSVQIQNHENAYGKGGEPRLIIQQYEDTYAVPPVVYEQKVVNFSDMTPPQKAVWNNFMNQVDNFFNP
jgi:hypothetical protein